jgi:DNA-directed RNA polymerase subunit F
MSATERKEITIAEAKALLEPKADELDPLQRRVLDYTQRFAKVSAADAPKLVDELVGKGEIDRPLAVQIANSMPGSIPEIRTFLGRQKIISEEAVNGILMIINKYRTSE